MQPSAVMTTLHGSVPSVSYGSAPHMTWNDGRTMTSVGSHSNIVVAAVLDAVDEGVAQ